MRLAPCVCASVLVVTMVTSFDVALNAILISSFSEKKNWAGSDGIAVFTGMHDAAKDQGEFSLLGFVVSKPHWHTFRAVPAKKKSTLQADHK